MYFDWNATTPLHPEVKSVYLQALEEDWRNPGSPSQAGARVYARLDEARQRLAHLIGGEAEDWVFTSGATEANNLLLHSAAGWNAGAEIWISPVEHPAVYEAADHYAPGRVRRLPVGQDGRIDLNRLDDAAHKARPSLISVMAANNETGVLQPWAEVAEWARGAGIPFHSDAAQWLGKEPITGIGEIDFLTLSGHKIEGPKGIGALKLKRGHGKVAGNFGGPQEFDHRGGTENAPAILAMVAAVERAAHSPMPAAVGKARDAFLARMKARWPGKIVVHGESAPRLPNTVSVAMPEFDRERWLRQLDRRGFEVSTGSACSTGKEAASGVLSAMEVAPALIRRTLRLSGGYYGNHEWDALFEAIEASWNHLQADQSGGPATVIEID